jgi:hypothetical protein
MRVMARAPSDGFRPCIYLRKLSTVQTARLHLPAPFLLFCHSPHNTRLYIHG